MLNLPTLTAILVVVIVILTVAFVTVAKKSMSRYDILLISMAHIAILFMSFALKTILIVNPNLDSILLKVVLIGLISFTCLIIRSLCCNGKFPSIYTVLLNFFTSSMLALVALEFDITSILHAAHFCLLYFLALFGLEFTYLQPFTQFVGKFTHLFAKRIDKKAWRMTQSSKHWRNESNEIINQLNHITNTINYELGRLNVYNLSFEEHFEDVQRYRLAGNQANAARSRALARSRRLDVQNSLSIIDINMDNIDSITRHAASIIGNRVRNNISANASVTINITRTLANNPMYNT